MVKAKRYGAKITVGLETEFLDKLADLSREKGISISGLVRMALREWIKQHEARSG